MAYKKKLTDEEFVELVINKELEIAGAPVRYNDLKGNKESKFFQDYTFKTVDQYLEWKNFFMEHFYDWQSKSVSKTRAEQEFQWWNLQWGLKYDFDFEIINLLKNKLFVEINNFFLVNFTNYSYNNIDVKNVNEYIFSFDESEQTKILRKVKKMFSSEDFVKNTVNAIKNLPENDFDFIMKHPQEILVYVFSDDK